MNASRGGAPSHISNLCSIDQKGFGSFSWSVDIKKDTNKITTPSNQDQGSKLQTTIHATEIPISKYAINKVSIEAQAWYEGVVEAL